MKLLHSAQTILIPDDVEVALQGRKVTVKGQYGTLEKVFWHIPVDMKLVEAQGAPAGEEVEASAKSVAGKRHIHVQMWFSTPRQRACIRSLCSHIENMFRGVSQKIQYKMRFVYAHFPINVNIVDNDTTLEIRNFMGEKRVRVVKLLPGVTAIRSKNVKDEIVLSGVDIAAVSRSCALIHQATLVRKKDIRMFLDGIYISERGTAAVEAN